MAVIATTNTSGGPITIWSFCVYKKPLKVFLREQLHEIYTQTINSLCAFGTFVLKVLINIIKIPKRKTHQNFHYQCFQVIIISKCLAHRWPLPGTGFCVWIDCISTAICTLSVYCAAPELLLYDSVLHFYYSEFLFRDVCNQKRMKTLLVSWNPCISESGGTIVFYGEANGWSSVFKDCGMLSLTDWPKQIADHLYTWARSWIPGQRRFWIGKFDFLTPFFEF